MNPSKSRGLDIIIASLDDLVALTKLYVGVSTGAVVVIVHAILESRVRPTLAALLTIAALCFCLSVILGLKALGHVASVKTSIGAHFWQEKDEKADVYFTQSDIDGARTKANLMERFFVAGILFSVIFLLAYFFFTLKHYCVT